MSRLRCLSLACCKCTVCHFCCCCCFVLTDSSTGRICLLKIINARHHSLSVMLILFVNLHENLAKTAEVIGTTNLDRL